MKNTEQKLFNDWIKVKSKLHYTAMMPHISEGEIWWCGIGKNVGVEINGKNAVFSRPVLVFKKLSRFCFLAIPLSTKLHTGNWYVPFCFRGKNEVAILAQIRVISVYRLYNRLGQIDNQDYQRIKAGFRKLYL